MANGNNYDQFENEGGGGGSFVMGLLTGTVLGAGLGILFAPKAGSELRDQLSEQAGSLTSTAADQYRRANEAAGDLIERGRDVYDKARDAVSRGADEAQRYATDSARDAERFVRDTAGEMRDRANEAANTMPSSQTASGPTRRS